MDIINELISQVKNPTDEIIVQKKLSVSGKIESQAKLNHSF